MASASTQPFTAAARPASSAPDGLGPDEGHGADAGANNFTLNGHELLNGSGPNGVAEIGKYDQSSASASASSSSSSSASTSPKAETADSQESSPVKIVSDIAADAVLSTTAAPSTTTSLPPLAPATALPTVNGIKTNTLIANGPSSVSESNGWSLRPTISPVGPARSMSASTSALPPPRPPPPVVPTSKSMNNSQPPPPSDGINNGRWAVNVTETIPTAFRDSKEFQTRSLFAGSAPPLSQTLAQSQAPNATQHSGPDFKRYPPPPGRTQAKGPSALRSPYQSPSPALSAGRLSTPAKVHIIDAAPDTGNPAPGPTEASGFPSPGRDHVHQDPKFIDDRTRITYGMRQALPDAARRAVRDNWEKCLLGSDFHQAFVLNAAIHHTSPASIQRGIRDFGKPLISSAKHQILDQMTTADLDELTDNILAKASDRLLDKALEKRLKTIDAKNLINALGRAERLGYEQGDVDDEAELASTQQPASGHAHAPPAQPQPQGQPHPSAGTGLRHFSTGAAGLPASTPALSMHCNVCFRRFAALSAYNHHVTGQVCTRSPSSPGGFKYNCQHCGQGFTTVMGLQYHNANKICGDFGEPSTTRPTPMPPSLPHPVAERNPSRPLPIPPSTPVPPPQLSQLKSSAPSPATGTPGLTRPDGVITDPYKHLTPEQLAALQEELRQAEITFTERMRQANLIPDPGEKKARLEGLTNSFGTKQSLIRKKYGVRLRTRRTKEEILAERSRMTYKTGSEIQIEMGIHPGNGPGRPVASSHRPSPPRSSAVPSSKPASGWASVNNTPQPPPPPPPATTHLASSPSPSPAVPAPPPAPMILQDRVHVAGKRAGDDGLEPPPPAKRVAYEPVDARRSQSEARDGGPAQGLGTADSPMALDDTDSSSDGGDDSGEDIPAQLPASVRQSLQRSSSVVGPAGTGSRPGSSSK